MVDGIATRTGPTIREILTELRREKAMRERVFPSWVRQGRMTETDRTFRMTCLQGAIDHFAAMAGEGGTGELVL